MSCISFNLCCVEVEVSVSHSLCLASMLVGIVKHQVANIASMLPHQFKS